MKMISYWTLEDDSVYKGEYGFTLITGVYNHKNEEDNPDRYLGVHWESYPSSRNVLAPCVIPENISKHILNGLLTESVLEKNDGQTQKIINAINYLNPQSEN